MAYFRCNYVGGGVKLPESVTISGGCGCNFTQAGTTNAGGSKTLDYSGSLTVPTMGYQKADISGAESELGTGNDIDISAVDVIKISTSKRASMNYHEGPSDNKYNYGGGSSAYSIVLHN